MVLATEIEIALYPHENSAIALFGSAFVTSKCHTPRDPEESHPPVRQVIGIQTLVPAVEPHEASEPVPLCCSSEAPGGKPDKFDPTVNSEMAL